MTDLARHGLNAGTLVRCGAWICFVCMNLASSSRLVDLERAGLNPFPRAKHGH